MRQFFIHTQNTNLERDKSKPFSQLSFSVTNYPNIFYLATVFEMTPEFLFFYICWQTTVALATGANCDCDCDCDLSQRLMVSSFLSPCCNVALSHKNKDKVRFIKDRKGSEDGGG